jgi:hypothetical protein
MSTIAYAQMHVILPRSPDLNTIANIFLECQIIDNNITAQSFSDLEKRINNVLDNICAKLIDRTINTMHGRINFVLKARIPNKVLTA